MTTMTLEKQGAVFVLTLTNGAAGNIFNDAVLSEYLAAFDTVEQEPGDASLLITCDDPKSFCNGIDLAWLITQPDPLAFITRLENFLVRLALLNLPVIAAINGNAYAGGALLATACDFRLMRADRGRFCYSEVKVKMPFTAPLLDIVQLLPSREAALELALTGNAWGGEECARRHVVHQALPAETLRATAQAFADDMATRHRPTYTVIKQGLRPALVALAAQRGLTLRR